MNLSQMSKFLLCLVLAGMLAACGPGGLPLYGTTNNNTADVQAKITAARDRDFAAQLKNPTSMSALLPPARWYSQPSWMNNSISMHGQSMPFNFWVNKALQQTGAVMSYQEDMNRNVPLSFDYTGTIRGALDKLASISGYAYTVEGNSVSWQEFVTQTFDVSFVPGASQYMMGGQAGNTNPNYSNVAAGTSSANVTTGEMLGNQYSNMQGNLSVWSDLEKTIKDMLSPDGKVMVSQATTTITVRDHPQNVSTVAEYLASMNKDLSRQVVLQVQVLQINLNKSFSYGIDWNMIQGQIEAQGGVGGNVDGTLFTSLGADATALGGIQPTGLGWGILGNGLNKILLTALQQQGDLSVVTQPRVVTLNNQVAQIAITTQKTYLASLTTTNTVNVGSQVSLTPGVVNTGFTLYVLPKIMGRDVYLQLTSELSNLDSLTTFTSGGSTSGSTSTSTQNSTASIQEPTVSSKSFNQRTMVPSGACLVLAGFRQVTNETNKASYFGIDPLGGRGAQQNNTEIIVIITPTIVGDTTG